MLNHNLGRLAEQLIALADVLLRRLVLGSSLRRFVHAHRLEDIGFGRRFRD